MVLQDKVSEEPSGGLALQASGSRGSGQTVGLIVLSTALLPLALIASTPVMAAFMWIVNLGAGAGFWTEATRSSLGGAGLITCLAVGMAGVQTGLLRRILPRPWLWFMASSALIAITGMAGVAFLGKFLARTSEIMPIMAILLLGVGLLTGIVQWFFLRRTLPRAYFLIIINLLMAGPIFLTGPVITNLIELATFMLLPGAIYGVGYVLLTQSISNRAIPVRPVEKRPRVNRKIWIVTGIAALIPLFFVFIWVYAASQLALAKSEGAYPTVEEAVIGYHSRGWGDARVVRVTDIQTGPNRENSQPHIWFGTATIMLDRIPEGYIKDTYHAGSFYVHTRDGWVLMPESAFPEFVGWVMELYHMEGVGR